MSASRHVTPLFSAEIRTDLAALDAHVVRPEEYEDAPELTDEMLQRADLYEGGRLVRRGSLVKSLPESA